MTKFRGFIAVDIETALTLINFGKEIKKTGANVKLVEPENVHITLKFLGDTMEEHIDEIENIMKESVKDIEPFDIDLEGVGVFPNQKYIKVIWIGIKQGELLGTIAKRIDDQLSYLGYKKERRDFSPHLTIARVKNAKEKNKLLNLVEKYKETRFAHLKVDSIVLKKSELTPKGPIYETLKEVKL